MKYLWHVSTLWGWGVPLSSSLQRGICFLSNPTPPALFLASRFDTSFKRRAWGLSRSIKWIIVYVLGAASKPGGCIHSLKYNSIISTSSVPFWLMCINPFHISCVTTLTAIHMCSPWHTYSGSRQIRIICFPTLSRWLYTYLLPDTHTAVELPWMDRVAG